MSAERGPSGTGHDGRKELSGQLRTGNGPTADPPVAVPGPASEPHHFIGRLPSGPASVSPAEPPLARYRLTVIFEAENDDAAREAEERAHDTIDYLPVIDQRLEKLL